MYHLFVLHADNPITTEFTGVKYGQNVVDLYPQLDRDNNHSNPAASESFAKRDPIGDVSTNDQRKSITRETTDKIVKDFGYAKIISGVSTGGAMGVGHTTITFDRPHGFGSIVKVASIVGGSGLTNGTYHNVKLLNEGTTTWDGATAKVTVASNAVTGVEIIEGGSGFTGTETLDIDNSFTGGSGAKVVIGVTGISTNVGDSLQITGIGTVTDSIVAISSVRSTTSVSIAVTTGDPDIITGQFAINQGPKSTIQSVSTIDAATGISTFTFTKSHGFVAGSQFRVLDNNNNKLGDFFVKTVVGVNTFSATTTVQLASPTTVLPNGMAPATPTSDKENENIGSRGLAFYDNETFNLGADVTTGTSVEISLPNAGIGTTSRFDLGSYLQVGDEIMRVKSANTSGSGDNELTVIRGALGTIQENHSSGELVKKIKPIPIEFRRPSIIRASGHTFEYLGFGPGNYSTALPQVQVRTLTEREEFLTQSQERSCGTVVYTGMNNRGDFFIGNKRVSSATGQERTFDAPIPTITGEDPSRLSVIFDEVVVKERLIVEGGRTNKILSQFDGPVTFNKEVKINDSLTVTGLLKLESDIEVTSETQSTNKDTGCMVLEGGLGVEKNLNVGGITTITDYLNVTDGPIILEAGTSNEGYRIDSGNDIEMSLFRSTVSGTPIVLGVKDGKRLVIGENGSGLVEIRDSVNGTYRARFTENEQVLYWNGSPRFQTYDSGVEITGVTTTGTLMVGAAATVTGNLNVEGNVTLGSNVTDTVSITGKFNSFLVPDTDDDYSLGSSTFEWKDLFIDGTAKIDALEADTAKVDDLTDGRVVIAGTDGELEDSANLTFDGTTLSSTFSGNLTGDVTGNADSATDLSINGTNQLLYQASNGDTQLIAAGSANQVLRSNGGSSAPSWTSNILGNAASADTVDVTANDTDADQFLLFKASSSTESGAVIRVDAGAKYNPSSNQLTINGNIIAFASDDRLKTNKAEITNALDKVVSLSGFTYNFNETAAELGFNTDITYVGVSAQEVKKVLPEAVAPAPVDGKYMTVQYEKIVPLLIEAIKELKAEVDQLKKHTH